MQKRCEHCDITYQKGQFCVKCGQVLSDDVTPPISTPKCEVVTSDNPAERTSAAPIVARPKPAVALKKRKASRKKKPFSGLKFAVFLLAIALLIIFGLFLFYINTSQLGDSVYRTNIDQESLNKQIIDAAIDGKNIDLTLDEEMLNALLYNYIKKYDENSPLGISLTDLYYSAERSTFVADYNSLLLNTSLLFDLVNIETDTGKHLKMTHVRLGNRELPLPRFLYVLLLKPDYFEFGLTNQYIDIDTLAFDDEGMHLEGVLDEVSFKQLFSNVMTKDNKAYFDYLIKDQSLTLPAYDNMLNYNKIEDFKKIMHGLMQDIEQSKNWFKALERTKGEELLSQINLLLPAAKKIDIASFINEHQANSKIQKQDFQKQAALTSLPSDLKQIAQAIEKYHKAKGVPAYIVASNGRVYSQTLQHYIDIDVLISENLLPKEMNYTLYATGIELAIGTETTKGFEYIKMQLSKSPSDIVKVPSKETFLNEIYYKVEDAITPQLLTADHQDRLAIVKLLSNADTTDASVYMRYLSSDGSMAFAIYSPVDDCQTIQQALFKKEAATWKLVKQIEGDSSVKDGLEREIKTQIFNSRLLPPYELNDFKAEVYKEEEIAKIKEYLTVNDKVHSEANYSFFSRIGDNVFMTFDTTDKVFILFEEGSKTIYESLIKIDNALPAKGYFSDLKPHRLYNHYFPFFTFIQD